MGWVYPTLALPVPPAGGWRAGGGSAHSNSMRKACQRSTQTTSDASYVGKFSYLFLIFLPTVTNLRSQVICHATSSRDRFYFYYLFYYCYLFYLCYRLSFDMFYHYYL